jgi:TolC family type I secretion outer membrane protein
MRLFPLFLLLAVGSPAVAAGHDDPRGLIQTARPPISPGQRACAAIPAQPLTLPDLVDIALCNNPQTAISWASVRAAAANVGVAQSANLPTVSATFGPVLTRTDSFSGSPFGSGSSTEVDTTARLALSYLLFDFGTRAAQIDASRASQRAALAQFADAAQGVALTTVTAFNTLQADLATATAAEATVAFAQKSYDFADGRKRAGTITGADRLQALTSLSQAQLTLIQARGNIATSRAQLAVAIGLPPETRLDLAAVPPLSAAPLLKSGAQALIAQAERLRPDIAASRANIDVADANLRAARAAALPTINVSASNGVSAVDRNVTGNSGQVGVTLSVPIFSGFNRRYTIAAARAESERQTALAEQTRQQAGLTVYTGYVALDTAVKSLVSARDLIASAQASADLAQGRYKAGVGLFTDLLNAQSALASARQQLVTAEFNVRTSDANLARAVGGIGDAVDELRGAR